MPGFDGTGPAGQGSMTGRGFGNCAGARPRMGCGCGCGRGYGRRFWRYAPVEFSEEDQRKILQEELKDLEAEKEAIETRLKSIKKKE